MKEFEIKSDVFNGPIEVLLSLVEKRKLFINEISLTKIADDYIYFVDSLDKTLDSAQTKKENIADFIYVATTLLLIKSKSLLPNFSITNEEQEDIKDLQKRLLLFKEVKQLGAYISERMQFQSMFQKEFSKNSIPIFSPSEDMILDNMFLAVKNILEKLPKKEFKPKISIKETITLEEVINNLETRIKEGVKIVFSEFSGKGKKDKVNIVISFLAMLELIKQGSIYATQANHFGEINIETTEINTPSYN